MILKEKYKTGVLWQDIQHTELIDIIEKLSNPVTQKSAASIYTYTVGYLVTYALHHFNLEEGYMDEYKYPDTKFHKKAHREFIQTLKGFRKKYPTYSQEAVDDLKKDIQDWILNHICGNDQKLGEFILEAEKQKLLKQ